MCHTAVMKCDTRLHTHTRAWWKPCPMWCNMSYAYFSHQIIIGSNTNTEDLFSFSQDYGLHNFMQSNCFGQKFETSPTEVQRCQQAKVPELVVILLEENVDEKETVCEWYCMRRGRREWGLEEAFNHPLWRRGWLVLPFWCWAVQKLVIDGWLVCGVMFIL